MLSALFIWTITTPRQASHLLSIQQQYTLKQQTTSPSKQNTKTFCRLFRVRVVGARVICNVRDHQCRLASQAVGLLLLLQCVYLYRAAIRYHYIKPISMQTKLTTATAICILITRGT